MKKLLSLLLVATIITSTLCVSYFAIDTVDNLSTVTTSEPTEEKITKPSSVISTSDEATPDEVTTEPSSSTTESSTTESTTEPTTSSTEPTTEPSSTQPRVVKVTSIKLNKSNYTLYKGQNFTLKATVHPTNADNKKVAWKSSNSKVATVDSKGKVVAKGKGTCVITVSAVDGSKVKAKCNITVKQLVTSVKINKSTALIKKKGKTTTLKATIYPSNANYKKVTWSVSKSYKKNISVTSKGVVKALKNSTYGWVYATAKDGSKKSAKCLVIVGNRANKVQIGKYNKKKFTQLNSLKLNLNKTYTLKKKVSNTTTKKKKTIVKKVAYTGVTWKSSNPKVISVNSNGKIKALKYGSATITVTTMDGSRKTAKCKVTVPKLVSKITFNKGLNGNIDRDGYRQLNVTVEPKDATNQSITWKSSNTKVATVNKNGKVKGVGNGSATITATAKDGSKKKATFKVTVKVGLHTKLTYDEFVYNKNYVQMYCDALNDYFKSCGAVINPNMVGHSQWCVNNSSNFYGYETMYEFIVGTVDRWTYRMSLDNLHNRMTWKNFTSAEDAAYEKFLEETDKISNPLSSEYNPKKMLDPKWNGWEQFCAYKDKDDRMNIYVYPKLEGNFYTIYMYWDWDCGLKEWGIPTVD